MKYVRPILCTMAIMVMTFLNFYRFAYEGPNKTFVFDSTDCSSWCIILAYFFLVRKYTNPLINALFLFNAGGCLIWFVKVYFADSTRKYSIDWLIGGAFVLISFGRLILEIATSKKTNLWTNQTTKPGKMKE